MIGPDANTGLNSTQPRGGGGGCWRLPCGSSLAAEHSNQMTFNKMETELEPKFTEPCNEFNILTFLER